MIVAAMHVIPAPDELDDAEVAFEKRYAELDRFLGADELEHVAIWPLPGVILKGDSLRLDDDLEIDTMTDAELGIALDTESVKPWQGGPPILDPQPQYLTCLRYRYRLPKVTGDPDPHLQGQEGQRIEGILGGIRSAIEESLTLALPDPVMVGGRFVIGPIRTVLGLSVSWQPTTVPQRLMFRVAELDEAHAILVKEVWQAIRRPGLLNRHKGLALALRRLSYQAQRERPEDELLDIMIAAEALYLSDLGNESYRGELRYRLSLRAALWADLDEVGFSRREVFKIMQSAYDARSAIAHGGNPKPKDVKVRGEQVLLADLVKAVRVVMTAGCRAALVAAMADRGWPVDWEVLVFGELATDGVDDVGPLEA